MPTKVEKDSVTGTETTGHVWDDIRELNTPLPKWWVYVFYATILWSIGYYVLYPSWPLVTTYVGGTLGYSSRANVEVALAEAKKAQGQYVESIANTDVTEIANNPDLLHFALAGGRAAFNINCAPCHAPGGAGRPGGYPVLADDAWLWGGDLETILQTIDYGIRSGHEETRESEMPAFGADGVLDKAQVGDVAEYVLSLSGKSSDAAAADRGKPLFEENCVACHGEQGEGTPELGAPRLNDQIWLYGGDKADIVAQVNQPKHGVMPAWVGRLDPVTIKMLAVYVHSLGGGQ
jgi:cytochrome c oxidase cbb3-type subunit 3